MKDYSAIESYMISKMNDSAHDIHHVYRVLNGAVDIASHENGVNMDVVIAACLLHDIGREQQFKNPDICHALIGGEMAYEFLLSLNWENQAAGYVKDCIQTHRYRSDNPPQSIEAKILFDADKLDVCGAVGIARTFLYQGHMATSIYNLDENKNIIMDMSEPWSFFQEYNFKLKNVHNSIFTERAKILAAEYQKTADNFCKGLLSEITTNYKNGIDKYLAIH